MLPFYDWIALKCLDAVGGVIRRHLACRSLSPTFPDNVKKMVN